jgi:hypothetical protein
MESTGFRHAKALPHPDHAAAVRRGARRKTGCEAGGCAGIPGLACKDLVYRSPEKAAAQQLVHAGAPHVKRWPVSVAAGSIAAMLRRSACKVSCTALMTLVPVLFYNDSGGCESQCRFAGFRGGLCVGRAGTTGAAAICDTACRPSVRGAMDA